MNTKKYTKKEIVHRVADRLSQPEVKTAEVVTATLDVLREMMSEENDSTKIELRNFGTFSVKQAKAKPPARNLRTNEEIYVPPHRMSYFNFLKIALQKLL